MLVKQVCNHEVSSTTEKARALSFLKGVKNNPEKVLST